MLRMNNIWNVIGTATGKLRKAIIYLILKILVGYIAWNEFRKWYRGSEKYHERNTDILLLFHKMTNTQHWESEEETSKYNKIIFL